MSSLAHLDLFLLMYLKCCLSNSAVFLSSEISISSSISVFSRIILSSSPPRRKSRLDLVHILESLFSL